MNKPAHLRLNRLSVQDFLALEDVARRLACKYPPDWLERNGRQVYGATLAASFALAIALELAWEPWWGFLVPLLLPPLVLVILPRCLLGRAAGRPRWAHRLAVLDCQDAELVGRIAAQAQGPALSGERFFEIWRHARCCIDHQRG